MSSHEEEFASKKCDSPSMKYAAVFVPTGFKGQFQNGRYWLTYKGKHYQELPYSADRYIDVKPYTTFLCEFSSDERYFAATLPDHAHGIAIYELASSN